MATIRPIAFFLLLFTVSFLSAQSPRYSILELSLAPEQWQSLETIGLLPDHYHRHEGKMEAVYSAHDRQRLEDAGIPFQVIAADAEAFFADQIQLPSTRKTAGTTTTPQAWSFGSMGGYLTYAEMLQELDSMVVDYPTLIVGPDTIGYSFENRPILLYKLSDNPGVDEAEPEVLYTALHHSREPMAMHNLIYYMQYLLENQGTDPEAAYLVANREMYFVPCINPDGYIFNQLNNPNGGGLWRKNRRPTGGGEFGIDLNRNYGYEHGYDNLGSSPDPASDLYRGPSGFSEPETQAIRDLCLAREFRVTFNYHSFGNLLIRPWGYDDNDPLPDVGKFELFGDLLTEDNNYFPGSATQTVGYNANGNSDDWMYGEQMTKDKIFSFTPEAGPGMFQFWPPNTEIIPISEANLQANLVLAWLAGDYVIPDPDVQPAYPGPTADIPTDFLNAGLDTTGQVIAEYFSLSAFVTSHNGPFTFSNLPPDSIRPETFSLQLDPNTPQGEEICGVIRTTMSGTLLREDTICFRYGLPQTVFNDTVPASPLAWTGGWNITNAISYSPDFSITDSPGANYPAATFNELTLSQPIDLTNFVLPQLQFRAQWEIEQGWDYCQVQISTNGQSWTPLAGQFTQPGAGSFQPTGEPVYDGTEASWVLETMDLTPYAGSQILIRFLMASDNFIEQDGFYFDDLRVTGYPANGVSVTPPLNSQPSFLYPNPGQGTFRVALPAQSPAQSLRVMDLSGKVLHTQLVDQGQSVELERLSAGLYLYQIGTGEVQKLIVR